MYNPNLFSFIRFGFVWYFQKCVLANDALNLIRFVSNTILDSSKRKKIFSDNVLPSSNYENIYDDKNIGNIPLCSTLCLVRVKAINRFIQNYERILLTVEDILNDPYLVTKEKRAIPRRYKTKLWKFEMLFVFNFKHLWTISYCTTQYNVHYNWC